MARRTLSADGVDVAATLRPLGPYRRDPSNHWGPASFAKALDTPAGAGSVEYRWSGGRVEVEAWGSGGDWLLDHAPGWLGMHDDVAAFRPLEARVERWWRLGGRFRLAASGSIWHHLLLVIVAQRVTGHEAVRAWLRMCRRWGRPAPGPLGLRLAPSPDQVAALHYTDLHSLNIERRRATALIEAGRCARQLEGAALLPASDAVRRIMAIPGLGVWTATSVVSTSHGDPDTIVLRDYWLPTVVNHAFTGESRRLDPANGGDERMCELLEPWAGQRQRVVRLIGSSVPLPNRRAPRAVNPDISAL